VRRRISPSSMAVALAALLVTAALAPAATAQSLYVGGAYSWATTDVKNVNAGLFETKASAYKLLAGLEVGNFFGAEAAWVNFGTYDATGSAGTNQSGQAKLDGWDMALTARLPIGMPLTLYGKLGYFFWDSQISGTQDLIDQLGNRARSGEDPFYGVGLRVNFGRTALFGEWEHYPRGNDVNSDLVSLGLRFSL
jgi:hypothetical protein